MYGSREREAKDEVRYNRAYCEEKVSRKKSKYHEYYGIEYCNKRTWYSVPVPNPVIKLMCLLLLSTRLVLRRLGKLLLRW